MKNANNGGGNMLGRKIFSILCLLALTVLLGACGSEDQTVATNAPVNSVDNGSDVDVDSDLDVDDDVSTGVSSFRTLTGGVAEFKSLVSSGSFISVEGFKSAANINYDNVGLNYLEFSGKNKDLYDADYSNEGGFLNYLANLAKGVGDAFTPDLNYGSYSINIRRTIYGNSIQREDGLSSEDLLEELKTIVVNGTYKSNMITQFGSAAYLIEHGGVEYVIDLNQPLMANPVKAGQIDKDGNISFYQYSNWTQYTY